MDINAPETYIIHQKQIACDGTINGNKALGHPKIFLKIGAEGFVECPYCDRRYVYQAPNE